MSGFPSSLNCIVHNLCTIVKPTGRKSLRLRFLHVAPTLPLSQIATPLNAVHWPPCQASRPERQRGGFFLDLTGATGLNGTKALFLGDM